jgi:hypothetical protein
MNRFNVCEKLFPAFMSEPHAPGDARHVPRQLQAIADRNAQRMGNIGWQRLHLRQALDAHELARLDDRAEQSGAGFPIDEVPRVDGLAAILECAKRASIRIESCVRPAKLGEAASRRSQANLDQDRLFSPGTKF